MYTVYCVDLCHNCIRSVLGTNPVGRVGFFFKIDTRKSEILSTVTLTTGTNMVPETSENCNHLTWLMTRENVTEVSRQESLVSYEN